MVTNTVVQVSALEASCREAFIHGIEAGYKVSSPILEVTHVEEVAAIDQFDDENSITVDGPRSTFDAARIFMTKPIWALELLAGEDSPGRNTIVKHEGLTQKTFEEVLGAFSTNAKVTHLLVSPQDFGIGMDIAQKSGIELLVINNWDRDQWMLCDASSETDRPFISEGRGVCKFEQTATNLFKVTGRHKVKIGNPRLAVLVTRAVA